MHTYEIRILRRDGQQLLVECRLMGDHAARRRARTLAMDGDLVEIWRDMTCIFELVAGVTIH